MHVSFEYCIDPKDHKSEEACKEIAVEGTIWPKLWPDAKDWLAMKDGGVPPEH